MWYIGKLSGHHAWFGMFYGMIFAYFSFNTNTTESLQKEYYWFMIHIWNIVSFPLLVWVSINGIYLILLPGLWITLIHLHWILIPLLLYVFDSSHEIIIISGKCQLKQIVEWYDFVPQCWIKRNHSGKHIDIFSILVVRRSPGCVMM